MVIETKEFAYESELHNSLNLFETQPDEVSIKFCNQDYVESCLG